MTDRQPTTNESTGPADDSVAATEALAVELETLREENRRLRAAYEHTRRASYRRTALGMASLGLLGLIGSLAFPDSRPVLVALGGTGLFAALLTYYLTPERVVVADVGERVYDALAGNEQAVADELGLQDDRLYVPLDEASGVRLFVPQQAEFNLPSTSGLRGTLVVTDDERQWGLALRPCGEALSEPFERTLTGGLATDPVQLVEQVADGIVDSFELADAATPDVEPGRATVAIAGSTYGGLDGFDHPVPSLIAVTLARGLDRPISLAVTPVEDDRADYLVTCNWETATNDSAEVEPATADDIDDGDEEVDGQQSVGETVT